MCRVLATLGCLGLLAFAGPGRIVADEQERLEEQIRAVVKQQQDLEQQRLALQKQLEEAKAKASGYVIIKTTGKLILPEGSPFYAIRANQGAVLVRFIRGEDKNRQLDAYMKSLEGKTVVAECPLFRFGGEANVVDRNIIDVQLHDEKQVRAVEEK